MKAYTARQLELGVAPDTKQTLLIAASSGQAMDWAGSTISSTDAETHVVRFSGQSTVGAAINFYVSLNSTRAAAPSSGLATGTTGGALPSVPVHGERVFRVPPGSTGFSVAGLSSGYITAEVWKL